MLKGTDNHRSRLMVAAILNVALAIYVLPRIDHLLDIRDYRYVTASSPWIYAVVAVPSVALLILIPVLRSNSRFQQWFAIGLSFFPGFLALMGWWQLLEIWIADR